DVARGGLFGRAAETVEFLASFLPGVEVERVDHTGLVQDLARDHANPERQSLRRTLDRNRSFPELGSLIPTPGGDPAAVGAERHGGDRATVGKRGADGSLRLCQPELGGA